jgi:LPS O-antigen subunit length determinant protein (WzzB/FepE family)
MEKDNLEILLEDIRGKFDLVLEGHELLHKEIRDTRKELCEKIQFVDFKVEALNQKIDNVHDKLDQKIDNVHDKLDRKIDNVHDKLDQKIDNVEAKLSLKLDAVAADLKAHREDTEAHPKIYQVKE